MPHHRVAVSADPNVSHAAVERILAAADAAFPELAHRDDEELLPRTPRVARCRLCGVVQELTREHLPPRAAFNKRTSRSHTFSEYLARGADGALPGGSHEQGGIWGYTLCAGCNNLIGVRYADEYRLWAGAIVAMLRREKVDVRQLEALTVQPRGHLNLTGTPRPGAFVREALAMMCSVSGGFDLAGHYPVIRRLVVDGSVEPLPEGVSLGLTAFLGGYPRIVGPQVTGDHTRGTWQVVMEVAAPPFAVRMILGGTMASRHVFDLTPYTLIAPDERQDVEGDLEIGFGMTAYPGDYRTRGMVERAESS